MIVILFIQRLNEDRISVTVRSRTWEVYLTLYLTCVK